MQGKQEQEPSKVEPRVKTALHTCNPTLLQSATSTADFVEELRGVKYP